MECFVAASGFHSYFLSSTSTGCIEGRVSWSNCEGVDGSLAASTLDIFGFCRFVRSFSLFKLWGLGSRGVCSCARNPTWFLASFWRGGLLVCGRRGFGRDGGVYGDGRVSELVGSWGMGGSIQIGD